MLINTPSRNDLSGIPYLVEAAFGRHDEAVLVDELRRTDAIAFELVATDRDILVGHILMSRLVSPEGCLALAPLSVHPDRQKQGIGSSLVKIATETAEERGYIAAFVLGNPAYYGRFGYEVERASDFETSYPVEFTAACVFDETAFRSLPRELVYATAF